MGEMEMVLKGQEGWMTFPGQGTMPLPENEKRNYTETFFRDPVIYFTKADQVQYIGKRKLGVVETEDLLVSVGEYKFHLLLDPSTNLPAGLTYTQIGEQGPVEKVETLSDYKTIDGLLVPMKTVITADGQKESEAKVQSIQFNVQVDPKTFEKG